MYKPLIIAHGFTKKGIVAQRTWLNNRKVTVKSTHTWRARVPNKGKMQKIGNFDVHAWSLSGIESTIVVSSKGNDGNCNKFKVAFDMGYATGESVSCEHVFISHGHMDHVAGLVHHAMKRNLRNMKPAKYYAPPHLIDPLRDIAKGYCTMQGDSDRKFIDEMSIQKIEPGETVDIGGSCRVMAFPTVHRVPSQGYILYTSRKHRKPEYSKCSSEEMRKLIAEGVEVNGMVQTPQVAYTGDTTSEIFTNVPTDDLLKVKLLITEATYIDSDVKQGKSAVERAKERGHIHLQEIVDNAEAFDSVEHLLLVHFSDKYSIGFIQRTVENMIKDKEQLCKKVHLGTLMKESQTV